MCLVKCSLSFLLVAIMLSVFPKFQFLSTPFVYLARTTAHFVLLVTHFISFNFISKPSDLTRTLNLYKGICSKLDIKQGDAVYLPMRQISKLNEADLSDYWSLYAWHIAVVFTVVVFKFSINTYFFLIFTKNWNYGFIFFF